MITRVTRVALVVAVSTAGCLDPLVGDQPSPGAGAVLPAGTVLPALDDDPVLGRALVEHDGVGALIPRQNAFAGGQPVRGWDLGPVAPAFAAPIYALVKRSGADVVFVPHNTIIDSLPGEAGYSPYWRVFQVFVTDAYRGEVIPSVAALDDAVALGLVERPVAVDLVVDCPVVAAQVRLEVGGGQPPLAPPRHANVRGRTVAYYDFGAMAAIGGVRVDELPRYVVRREGGEPLSEPARGVDLTGDGDTNDTNDVYARDPVEQAPIPRCRTVNVAVAAATASIDTNHSETMADLRAAEQLFDPGPVAGTVVGFTVTDDVRHCVLQREDGSP